MDVHHRTTIRTTSIGGKHLHTQPVPQQGAEVVALEGLLQAGNGYSKEPVTSATELKAL